MTSPSPILIVIGFIVALYLARQMVPMIKLLGECIKRKDWFGAFWVSTGICLSTVLIVCGIIAFFTFF